LLNLEQTITWAWQLAEEGKLSQLSLGGVLNTVDMHVAFIFIT